MKLIYKEAIFMSNEIRRNMALFPISIVMQLTELTARQIRYYEEHALITPARNQGKQRIFTLNDIDRLLEIKDLIDQGVNIAGIKAVYHLKAKEEKVVASHEPVKEDLTEKEVHQLLKKELFAGRAGERVSLIQGELSRFFH
jgi:MerR family glutamine synthetase transcriptional repressor